MSSKQCRPWSDVAFPLSDLSIYCLLRPVSPIFKVNIINPCHVEKIKMPCPFQIFSQSDCLIQIIDINSHTEWQTVQIPISWLLLKPTDLDLHHLQRQYISSFIRTRVNSPLGSDKNNCKQVNTGKLESRVTSQHSPASL